MSTVYTGHINLGVLSVPIRLVSAVSEERIPFRQLSPCHESPIEQRSYCRKGGEEVAKGDLLKGYETETGKYVVITADELAQAALPISKVLEIEECLPVTEIDFRYFDKPYLALPPAKDPGRLYALLRAALASTQHVGIGRIMMRTKQHLAAVRTLGDFLVVQTMRWPDEITSLAEFGAPEVEVKPGELKLAETLITSMVGDFRPERYVDQYREHLVELIAAKARGEVVTFTEKQTPPSAETDVMALLTASIEAVNQRRPAA